MTFEAYQFDDGKKDGHVKYRIQLGSQFHEISIPKRYIDNWTAEQLNESIRYSFLESINITLKGENN